MTDSGAKKTYSTGGIIPPTTSTTIPATTATPPGGVYTWPSTTSTTGITWGTPKSAPKPEIVDLPPRMTRKVLIAFLDDDDNPVWAKKLLPEDLNISFDSDGNAQMDIELSLVKYYGD